MNQLELRSSRQVKLKKGIKHSLRKKMTLFFPVVYLPTSRSRPQAHISVTCDVELDSVNAVLVLDSYAQPIARTLVAASARVVQASARPGPRGGSVVGI